MACIDSCPTNALDYCVDGEGFFSIVLETESCEECKKCERSCPVLSVIPEGDLPNFMPYAVWSKNNDIRLQSASGGVFAECASFMLKNGGVVVGAVIHGKKVYHTAISEIGHLGKLQKSKYMQSNTKGIYKATKQFLKLGKTVLFSGTPCQIAGLKAFVKNSVYTGKLLTAQVVCHGVPSGRIIELFEKIKCHKIKTITAFRAKMNGWKNSHIFIYTDENNSKHSLPLNLNLFVKMYGNDLLLRQSCYDCKFHSLKGLADLSLADYWGNKSHPDEHNKGLSFVTAHTAEGEDILRRSDLIIHQTSWQEAIPANPRIVNGKNWLNYHPARLFLKFHINYLPSEILEKIYANKICKTDFILFPYKIINKILFIINSRTNKNALNRILKKWDITQKQ
jgi:coenzyme F420-reducing hydrogenase beta subunit